MPKGPVKKAVLLFSILLFPSVLYLVLSTGKHNFMIRPFYGPKEVIAKGDTLFYQIPDVAFTNCKGSETSLKDLRGNILVVAFCSQNNLNLESRINSQMLAIQDRFREKSDVRIVSVSLVQESSALCRIEEAFDVNSEMWNVGMLKDISVKTFAEDYLLLPKGDTLNESALVLIDKDGHIRGYRDASQYVEVKELADDIKILKAEEFIPRKKKK